MPPIRAKPIATCNNPAINTAQRNNGNSPILWMAANTNAAKPAAGPLTLKLLPLREPITIPPIIPEIIPLKNGAPDAKEIPKHNGNATRNTTTPAGKSFFTNAKRFDFFIQ